MRVSRRQPASHHLQAEGYRADQVHLDGNTMVDTLLANIDRARCRGILARLGLQPQSYGLVTMHRPANVDDPEVFGRVLGALRAIGRELPLVFPVHPRTRAHLNAADATGITLLDPLGYLDFVALEADARLMLTDSGGCRRRRRCSAYPASP